MGDRKTARWGSRLVFAGVMASMILALSLSGHIAQVSASPIIAAPLCGNGSAPDYGFTYDLQQAHWTVDWQDYASEQAVTEVDAILDRLNGDSIAQTMITRAAMPASPYRIRWRPQNRRHKENSMTTITYIADYLPLVINVESGLTSSHFTLSDGTIKGLRILLPKGAILDEPAILAFVAEPSRDAECLTYEIEINQNWKADFTENVPLTDSNNENFRQVIGSGEFTGGASRGLWFVIDSGILNREALPYQVPGYGTHNDGNLIVDVWFRVTGGHGSLKFSNVVLWFKREIVADAAV